VDIDFPVAYRAFGPLEAVAQVAGRCNRSGLLGVGVVKVFVPEADEGRAYPDPAYERAADVTRLLLLDRGANWLDVHSPEVFEEYYRRLYATAQPGALAEELEDALTGQNYEATAKAYRLIENEGVNILVPYRRREFDRLVADLDDRGLTAAWMRAARNSTVNRFRPPPGAPLYRYLRAAPIRGGGLSDDWWVYLQPEGVPAHYDRLVGLDTPEDTPFLAA